VWRGRDYRRGQRHRNKATQEKYRFYLHRLFFLLVLITPPVPVRPIGPRSDRLLASD
jgi:hypothetical protein